MFAGQHIDQPWEAFAQANVINEHANKIAGGKTYAELPQTDPNRATVMNASFLQASLFTSVVAFGVAAMAAVLGLVLVVIGLALRSVANDAAAVTAPVSAKQTACVGHSPQEPATPRAAPRRDPPLRRAGLGRRVQRIVVDESRLLHQLDRAADRRHGVDETVRVRVEDVVSTADHQHRRQTGEVSVDRADPRVVGVERAPVRDAGLPQSGRLEPRVEMGARGHARVVAGDVDPRRDEYQAGQLSVVRPAKLLGDGQRHPGAGRVARQEYRAPWVAQHVAHQFDHAGDHDVGGPDRGQRVHGDEDGEAGLPGQPLDEPPVPRPQLAKVRAAVEEHETSGRPAPWGDLVHRPTVGAHARDDVHPPAEAGGRLVGRGARAQGGHRCPGRRSRRILLVGTPDARRIPDQAAGETHR